MAEGICVPSFLLNSEMSEEGDGGRIRPDAVDSTSYSWEEIVIHFVYFRISLERFGLLEPSKERGFHVTNYLGEFSS